MRRLTVNRFKSDRETTVSLVSLDGRFVCFGLEDEHREEKRSAETRIPAGTYKVGVRTVGGFHGRYSRKFGDFHQGMLQIMDVPGFEYILIHVGNTDKDTAGCLLVGTGCYAEAGNMSIQASVKAYRKLYLLVIEAALAGELEIEVIDNDL